jgi:hypothetical protein
MIRGVSRFDLFSRKFRRYRRFMATLDPPRVTR